MKLTQILSIAIIAAALPFGARADYTYNYVTSPATVSANGTVNVAAVDSLGNYAGGPYATVVPTPADETHIATTAYVKGAYNDTIAAINSKQTMLVNANGDPINHALDGVGDMLGMLAERDMDYAAGDAENFLVSSGAVAMGILSQRVEIYTTWDDDTANGTTLVPLTTVTQD